MAIKFSELRGLIKDTNIQTVKMSDPVYFHTIKGVQDGHTPSWMKGNRVSFYKLKVYKEQGTLYSHIVDYYPLSYVIRLNFNINDIANNISFQYDKKIWVNDFAYIYVNYKDRLFEWNKGLDIFKCYETKDSNIYKNLQLVKVVCEHSNYNNLIDVPIMWYRNGNWVNISPYQTKDTNINSVFIRENCYKDTIIDNDLNIDSSVLLYTNQFSFSGDGSLIFYYAYKGNDKIDRLYKDIRVQHVSYSGLHISVLNQMLNIKNNRYYFAGLDPSYSEVRTVN